MHMKGLSYLSVIFFALGGWGCSSSTNTTERTLFTKADSVTDTYLTLQDTLHNAWNLLIKDESEKIRNLDLLLSHLMSGNHFDRSLLTSLDNRLDQLRKIKFTQKTLSNPYVIEEYDFACNSILSELISMTETKPELLANRTIQNLVDHIKNADQRVDTYRSNYDSVAELFNSFITNNKDILAEIDRKINLEKRPQFKAASKDQ